MKVDVTVPEEYMGDVMGDINSRRGRIEGMEARLGVQVISSHVPLSEMFGYVTTLRTLSSGRATSTMEFDSFKQAPEYVSEEVIKKVKGIIS